MEHSISFHFILTQTVPHTKGVVNNVQGHIIHFDSEIRDQAPFSYHCTVCEPGGVSHTLCVVHSKGVMTLQGEVHTTA